MDSTIIFQNLIFNPTYAKKVIPFLKSEYFSERSEAKLLEVIQSHSTTYNSIPTVQVIATELSSSKGMTEHDFQATSELLNKVSEPFTSPDIKWLIAQTEEFCKGQSCYKAVLRSISIINNEDELPRTAIPELLRDALAVSFDSDVGHDYVGAVEERYKKLHAQTARFKTDIKQINDAYGGGIPRKTLSLFVAQSGGGKSLVKSHLAAHFYKQGRNVLYITLELAEERIGERVDANMFKINVVDIPKLSLEEYKEKVEANSKQTPGRLFIKEYPPAAITASHLRALLDELELKQDFTPDVVFVDYLNLMNSSRYKSGGNHNSYTTIKAVAEELRSIAVERDLAIISSTQANRGGYENSDMSMTNVSESMGIAMTSDAMFALIRTEELDELNQVMVKVLKTRFSDKTNHRFVVGVNLNQMSISEVGDGMQSRVSQEIKPQDHNPSTQLKVNKQRPNTSSIKV
jgi:archaellum biogenesis ATPase FlaH